MWTVTHVLLVPLRGAIEGHKVMRYWFWLTILAFLSSCTHQSRGMSDLPGFTETNDVTVRSVSFDRSRFTVDFSLRNSSEQPICLYRDAFSTDSVFNYILLRNKSGELAPVIRGDLMRSQDLEIVRLLPGDGLDLTATPLLHDIRDVPREGSLSVAMKTAGCNGEDGPTIRSPWTSLPE